jgi:Asp-tRNA(Asn)/Glu-tRNA(Gln) amidotransferase A subunit family amidase
VNEYTTHDGLALAALMRDGEVSPAELLEAAIARAGRVNPRINALVTPMFEQARMRAAEAPGEGSFAGVPFLLKDLRAQYAGVPTTAGSRLWRDLVPDHDSELVARHKRAGFVIFGKTNTPEFGCCPSTEGRLFGAVRNPWNPALSAGGSSGGSAAAVAAGIVPVAHASDGGGSIRIPAACCGVFGFKPSRGLNPSGPDYGEAWSGLSVEHVVSRSVRDSAAVLDATAGPAPGDPYCGPVPPRSFLSETGREPGRLRVAVQRHALSGAPVHPACIEALEDCVRLLESLGHEVEEATPQYDVARIGAAYPLLIAANVQAGIDQYCEAQGITPGPDLVENVIGILGKTAHAKTAADMVRATWAMHATGRQVAPFFASYDVLLTPVVATPPPLLGTLDTSTSDVQAYLEAVFRFIPFTALANIAGIPAMSVPLHWTADGVPLGAHFSAGFGRDGMLFSLAAQLERARPWWHRYAGLEASLA